MNLDSAFWVWNLVANVAYGGRYDVAYPEIQAKITELEGTLLTETEAVVSSQVTCRCAACEMLGSLDTVDQDLS